jgi:hypothetical protein
MDRSRASGNVAAIDRTGGAVVYFEMDETYETGAGRGLDTDVLVAIDGDGRRRGGGRAAQGRPSAFRARFSQLFSAALACGAIGFDRVPVKFPLSG